MCDCRGTMSGSSVRFSPRYILSEMCDCGDTVSALIFSVIHHVWDVWLWRYNVCHLCLTLSMIHHVWDTMSVDSDSLHDTSCLRYNVYQLCLILSMIHHVWDYNVCQLCLILSVIHHVWDTMSIDSVSFSPWYIMSEIQFLSTLSDSLHNTSCLRYIVYQLCLILSSGTRSSPAQIPLNFQTSSYQQFDCFGVFRQRMYSTAVYG